MFAETLLNRVMIFRAVEGVGNLSAAGIAHAANEPVTPRDFVFFRLQQVNAFQPYARRVGAELVERSLGVAPARHRLMNAALSRRDGRVLRQQTIGLGSRRPGESRLQ